ncbi:serine hydrolase [Streptomyces sp. MspMP-M5]|uniref:serine hydrolase n=1 Tax=unclassified Streptomyces TaxID=2593676 RepID=UPI000376EC99|nr:serine hydrolase [Streptomyces sp. MspMP-M5]
MSTVLSHQGQERPSLQKAIEAIVESGFLGVQLRVNDERGEWVGSAGVRELGQNAEPLVNGHFRIGSTTKNFVATSALMLVAVPARSWSGCPASA